MTNSEKAKLIAGIVATHDQHMADIAKQRDQIQAINDRLDRAFPKLLDRAIRAENTASVLFVMLSEYLNEDDIRSECARRLSVRLEN